MSIFFHLSKTQRVVVLLALLLGPCTANAADLKPDEVFNFGTTAVGSDVKHDFKIVNGEPTPMIITEVQSSCPCTRIVTFPKTILPQQTGIISIDTKMDQVGTKAALVTAVIEGNFPVHVFAIRGEVTKTGAFDPNIFAETKQLISLPKNSVTYIDVRSGIAFDEARIPFSMNMPLFDLQVRSYLKSKSLVIVGSGIDDMTLAASVDACQKAGFSSIKVLRGGIRQWQQAGGPLEGAFARQAPLQGITAPQLLTSANRSSWLALVPKHLEKEAMFNSAMQLKIVAYSDAKSVGETLTKALAQNTDVNGVALFADNEQYFAALSRIAPSLPCPLFEVSDPWSTFAALASDSAQASGEKPAIKTLVSGSLAHRIIGCPTCP